MHWHREGVARKQSILRFNRIRTCHGILQYQAASITAAYVERNPSDPAHIMGCAVDVCATAAPADRTGSFNGLGLNSRLHFSSTRSSRAWSVAAGSLQHGSGLRKLQTWPPPNSPAWL